MKEHTITPYTKRYFTCPCGGEEFSVEHLFTEEIQSAGPWYCHKCGVGWWIKMFNKKIEIIDSGFKLTKSLDILELDPNSMKGKPLYLLVEGNIFDDDKCLGLPKHLESKRYFYEEHTCPTNWFGNVREICIDGEHDPHELFKYVETRPFYKEPDCGPERFMDEDYVPET